MAYDPVKAKQYEDLYNQLEDIRQRMDTLYGEAVDALVAAHKEGLIQVVDTRGWGGIRSSLSMLEVSLPSLKQKIYR